MATVVNKVTFEILESVNTPDYDPAEWLINPDLSTIKDTPKKYWTVDAKEELVLKDQAGQAEADAAELDVAKLRLLAQIDARAESNITDGPGVEIPPGSGLFVSLSIKAQIKWTGWNAIADNWLALGLPFPFRVRTRDDSNFVEINSAQEVHDIYGQIAQTVAYILSASEEAKAAVVSATTLEEATNAAQAYLSV